jgi:hypothetical protein
MLSENLSTGSLPKKRPTTSGTRDTCCDDLENALGKGVRREAESEGSRCHKLGFDEQEPDTRPAWWGNPAMDGDARSSSRHARR